ncbi:hypothetical protein [Spiroplasma endosymbiont of Atherix ibis]|uniref:hypothetical protein n=1 Tax=Spiroplasma endosymbiont of Atherix ibis TaxID=3066291 RepID=UPI0030D0E00F
MKKALSLLTAFSGLIPGVVAIKNTIGCEEKNNMVKIYRLQEEVYNNSLSFWKPIIYADCLIIVLDKTKVEKYTLEDASYNKDRTQIKFYFKDGTINNTDNTYWIGPPEEYAKYIKSLIGFDPTHYDEWMPVWGARFEKRRPDGGFWEKDYKSKESFALNPKLVNQVFLKKQKENIFIKIEYIDGKIEEHLQTKGDLKYFHDQFLWNLKIHIEIIEE